MSGTPSPPRSVGVNMRDLGYLCLFPAMKEVIRLSSWRINDLGGVGRAIAMWVNFERTFDFTMLAFPCGVDLLRFQATISAFALLRAIVQFISSWSRLPVRWMPRSLKGSFSSLRAVWRVMFGSFGALPKRAYLVLSTFISSPDICWNCSMILSISCSWGMALGD